MSGIKGKDLQILSMLRNNCRMSLTDISRKTKVPVSTVYDRLKIFDGKVIRKHVALLDFSKLGYVVKAHIMLCVDKSQKEEFMSFIGRHNNVNSFFRINNGHDFLIEVLQRDINEFERFIEVLNDKFKIKDKKTFFIIEDIKREAFLADGHFLDCGGFEQ